MSGLRSIRVVAIVALVALLATSCGFGGGGDGRHITAIFSDGTGIYPASKVRVRGIDIGKVTDIRTASGRVEVEFTINDDAEVTADATAVIVPLTLLGERYIQLLPGESGDELADGATIPLERTGKPAELDELLEGLEDYVAAIDEDRAADLLTNLAEVLDDNGSELNQLLGNAADTIDLLASSSGDLNDIVSALATLSETVAARSSTIQELVRNYDSLSGVLADNQQALGDTVSNLDESLVELARLLAANEDRLNASVAVLTGVGRTLDRNHQTITDLLKYTVDLFAAADLAYDRERNMLPLNQQMDPATFGDLISERLASRLAGVCRRLANRVQPVPPELVACGDATSGFLDPLLDQLPGLIDELMHGGLGQEPAANAATEATLLTGLQQILALLPDLPADVVDDLSRVSEVDSALLSDLVANTPREQLPKAIEDLLGFLGGGTTSPPTTTPPTTTPGVLPPPPERRDLDDVLRELDDPVGGVLGGRR